jgi:AsmA-like C-terminal region
LYDKRPGKDLGACPTLCMKKKAAILSVLALISLLCGLALVLVRPTIAVLLRNRIQSSLSEHFQSQVQFSDFDVSVFPMPNATVKGLTLSHHNRKDVPPLIQVDEVFISLHWLGLLGPRLHMTRVDLKGLTLTFPPKQHDTQPKTQGWGRELREKYSVFVEELNASDAQIILLRAQPEKKPLVFLLHRLTLTNLSFEGPAGFEATLTNAVPRGEIHAKGSFGPWDPDTPRATPIQAAYQFLHADLSTIKGLEGTLSSTGSFEGPLDYLNVKGTTSIPNFTLRRVANPIELKTEFSASIDGTNGNTYLHSVEAHFLHSTMSVQGEVVDLNTSVRGRTINLDAQSKQARAEDLIRIAVKTDRPVLNGPAKLKAKIRIPEEDKDLSDRLDVTADFELTDGHFSNQQIQDKIDTLSRKGQGEPKNTEIDHVPTQLDASMHLKDAAIKFSRVHFLVPGASLDMQGTYALGDGALDFRGDLYLDAKLSQTTTGAKSLLLKAVDPFFKGKNGGARVPIKVTGTKDHPIFGLGKEGNAKKPETHNAGGAH